MTRIIIRAVPERSTDVEYLVKHIPHAEICWETYELEKSSDNIWNTFDKALEMAGDEPCVQMEEDVILTEGFVEKLEEAISEHPDQVSAYKGGKDKLFGFFVGQIMKATQGKANPASANKILKDKLDN